MRIYVKISDEMGDKLEHYANHFGMSKSGFVAYALGKHITELDYQADAYHSITGKLTDIINEQKGVTNAGITN